jgi:hypothetical protein
LDEVPILVARLNEVVRRLEALFPGRRFTLDGHLVGSVGEVIAAAIFDLELLVGSTESHDARASDGRLVQIKLTQSVAIGLRSCPQHLLVLAMNEHGRFSIPYNGPGQPAWEIAGRPQKNGQRQVTLPRLRRIDQRTPLSAKLPIVRPWTMFDGG